MPGMGNMSNVQTITNAHIMINPLTNNNNNDDEENSSILPYFVLRGNNLYRILDDVFENDSNNNNNKFDIDINLSDENKNALVRVRIEMITKGIPKDNSQLYLPIDKDFDTLRQFFTYQKQSHENTNNNNDDDDDDDLVNNEEEEEEEEEEIRKRSRSTFTTKKEGGGLMTSFSLEEQVSFRSPLNLIENTEDVNKDQEEEEEEENEQEQQENENNIVVEDNNNNDNNNDDEDEIDNDTDSEIQNTVKNIDQEEKMPNNHFTGFVYKRKIKRNRIKLSKWNKRWFDLHLPSGILKSFSSKKEKNPKSVFEIQQLKFDFDISSDQFESKKRIFSESKDKFYFKLENTANNDIYHIYVEDKTEYEQWKFYLSESKKNVYNTLSVWDSGRQMVTPSHLDEKNVISTSSSSFKAGRRQSQRNTRLTIGHRK
eukprot:TRINITY_DN4848_c0_g1_i4.p1 TRINITY_DN4848_c0_g1~~TRINITY_DN4848_c0_g1_i4.p1  ORF type:complete len:427 (+),score=192.36 TRINITY_DN4848_c0_g1_i4:345-1625(+)